MRKALFPAAAATAFISTAAWAAVTFDSVTGTGFVGKGDVQLAFGWNNAQLQSRAAGVDFEYRVNERYDVECEWDTVTGNGKIIHHDITVPKHVRINDNIAYEPRTRNQITGFILNGFDSQSGGGTPPAVGDACPGNNPGTVTAVTLTDTSGGGLYATYGGNAVLLQ